MLRSRTILQVLLVLAASALVAFSAAAQQRCPSIKAADGKCVDAGMVAAANKRATVVSSGFASYLGTPQGSLGLPFIPHERLFRDDPVVFGLPTNTVVKVIGPNVVTTRSK
jgi:hypothetical protein